MFLKSAAKYRRREYFLKKLLLQNIVTRAVVVAHGVRQIKNSLTILPHNGRMTDERPHDYEQRQDQLRRAIKRKVVERFRLERIINDEETLLTENQINVVRAKWNDVMTDGVWPTGAMSFVEILSESALTDEYLDKIASANHRMKSAICALCPALGAVVHCRSDQNRQR